MMTEQTIVIAAASRTLIGAFQGRLSTLAASDLAATAITVALTQAKLSGERVDEVLMGCVLSAGQGQAPARQAALKVQLPLSVGATTVNKMCG